MDQVFNLPPKFSEILTPNISAISPSLNFNDYSKLIKAKFFRFLTIKDVNKQDVGLKLTQKSKLLKYV